MKKVINPFKGLDMSAEAQEIRKIERFNEADSCPENISNWLPKIVKTVNSESPFKIPKTKIIKLDIDWWSWLRSDRYAEEDIRKFNEYLIAELKNEKIPFPLFMKSGIFGHKFDFERTLVKNDQEVGLKFLDLYYESMMLGADNTNEAAFREFVFNKDNRNTIYNGLPLNTEFRVFYDYDEEKVIGIANYWQPKIMEKALKGKELKTYLAEKANIVNEYDLRKEFVASEIGKQMRSCVGLSGKWSIDIMKVDEEYWLIDMARMEKSALVDCLENIR